MRFKKGSKMEVMNYYDYEGGVEKVSRRFVRKKIGSKICEEEEEDASRKQKRASPFCSSVHESSQKVKKVKPGSQRRYVSCDSYKKSYKIGGMHLLLPKIQTRF